jgi:RNA polymerase sigma-70 factor (ECF subfamily)
MNPVHPTDSGKGKGKKAEKNIPLTPGILEDLKLAKRAAKDPEAARILLERLGPRVKYTVMLLVRRDEELEDLIHGCLLAVLENLGNYRGTGSLEAWAGQLTYRVLMRLLKRKRRNEHTVMLVPDETGISSTTPEHQATRAAMADNLAFHFSKMPEKRRMAVVLRLVHGHSVAEIARLTDAPLNTVRDRIRVGLKELRQSIGSDRITLELFGRNRRE